MKATWLKICLAVAGLLYGSVHAEDIDIFAGTTEASVGNPNVIFVLDNTSNWSRLNQQWPDGDEQGVSEVRAIRLALADKIGLLNVGLVEYSTDGNAANNEGGYVRFDLQPLTQAAYNELAEILTIIEDDVQHPIEKRSKGNPYGHLAADFYNYLAGENQTKGGAGTPVSRTHPKTLELIDMADKDAYETNYSKFRSPLTTVEEICADAYMIFIGNTESSGPNKDDTTNSNYLKTLYEDAGSEITDAIYGDSSGEPLLMPEFTSTVIPGDPLIYGQSAACYTEKKLDNCTAALDIEADCNADETCECLQINEAATTAAGCKNDNYIWDYGSADSFEVELDFSGNTSTAGVEFNLDDWTKFLHNYGIPVTTTVDGEVVSERVGITTYTIDVFNAQPNAEFSSLLYSAADVGGGEYFQARNEQAIIDAIEFSLGDILAKSSSFAAVTLPLSTTNRAQVDNEVYIGMFRPYPDRAPRWYGNLKRYQLALFGGVARLADVNFKQAINPLTNFADDCAESFWTTDTGSYWADLIPSVEPIESIEGKCSTTDAWSDLPDGPSVEKGGVGQQNRFGPVGTARKLYVADPNTPSSMTPLDDSYAAKFGGMDVLDYFRGDMAGAGEGKPDSSLRPSVHADVVHSRPLSVRFDDSTVLLFYGTNDGLFRAVDTYTGKEVWSMIAPEHMSRIGRLYQNYPYVDYEGGAKDPNEPAEAYAKKDYFFDGPTGQLITYEDPNDPDSEGVGDLELAYIFPTMRRGGRMVYALDIMDPNDPQLLWRNGCTVNDPNDPGFADADKCTHDYWAGGTINEGGVDVEYPGIGQTWSTPVGGYLSEYPGSPADPTPVVMFGGGFDACLNADQKNYPAECNNATGKGVYLLDAVTGGLITYFPTDAPVMTEVIDIDLNFDGIIDFAYLADVAGSLYRIKFADLIEDISNKTFVPDSALDPLDDGEWKIEKIASMLDTERRFYNSPSVGFYRGFVIVAIGSGDRERPLEANYPYADDVQNTFFAILDRPFKDWDDERLAALDGDYSWTRPVIDLDGSEMYQVGTALDDPDTDEVESLRDYKGWYMNLVDRGEQVANPATIGGGRVFFNTFQPGQAVGADEVGICEEPLGIGTGYTVNLFAPEFTEGNEIAGGGLPIPPILATVVIPPGCETEPCDLPCDEFGVDCDPCATNPELCETQTVIIGLEGFEPIKIDPEVDPVRQRVYFTEDVDRLAK